jgi:hypothetical protein
MGAVADHGHFTAAELDEMESLGGFKPLIAQARRAIELEARVAELEAENARRKEHEVAALNEMAKARRKFQDVQSSLDWWRYAMYERGEETGLVKKLWDKAKELERQARSDAARIAELTEREGLERERDAWLTIDRVDVVTVGHPRDERHHRYSDGSHEVTLTCLGEHYAGTGPDYWQALRVALDEVKA